VALVIGSLLAALVVAPGAAGEHNALVRVSTGPAGGNGDFGTNFQGASRDGSRVFFETAEPLVSADTDSLPDVYERVGAQTKLVSTGPDGGNGDFVPNYRGSSGDGTRVFFVTDESLVSADTDTTQDLYERAAGRTTLLSIGPDGGHGDFASWYRGASDDGTRVFVHTAESLVSADTDTTEDVYERAGGHTTLLSIGPNGGNGDFDVLGVAGDSDDGSRVFFRTAEPLVSDDTDTALDLYERAGGQTALLSTGPDGGNGEFDVSFVDDSADGARVLFQTAESLVSGDTDTTDDVYERAGGQTTLVSIGPDGGNAEFDVDGQDASDDATRVVFETDESLVSTDTNPEDDVYERAGGQTMLVSTGPLGHGSADFEGASEDGAHIFFGTDTALVSADTDTAWDLYVRADGQTTLLSTGPDGGNGDIGVSFNGASPDGTRAFFTTEESLVSADTDTARDLYESAGGQTTLVSIGPDGGNGDFHADFGGVSSDGSRVFFGTDESLLSGDTDVASDLYEKRIPAPENPPPGGDPAAVSFSGPTNHPAGAGPSSVAVGDFNGDPYPDLVLTNFGADTVSVLLGGQGGAFGEATEYDTGASPSSVAVGDFNGDSHSDLAVANNFGHDVSVLFGDGAGSFAEATDYAAGSWPTSVAVGDFDGISGPDLAVANIVSGTVSVLLNDGAGNFGDPTSFTTGDNPESVAVGDFNGDSKLDLVVANQLSGSVSVLLGVGDGGFGDATNITVETGLDSLAVGDFNGDSKPDLAVTNLSSDEVSVLLGIGGGDFGEPTDFAVGSEPRSVAVGDFNGDSQLDLAVANMSSDEVSVLLGIGTGQFAAARNFAAGDAPGSIAVADLNGDSDPDLAVTNEVSDDVSVLLNNHAPEAAGDAYATDEDTSLNVGAPGVLGNDTDPDGDSLAAELVSGPSHGIVTLGGDGSFSYTPHPDYNGTDSFTYGATDQSADPTTATVEIQVRAVDDAPLSGPSTTPPAGATPSAGSAAPADPAIAQLRLGTRCVRPSRSGRVRIPIRLRMAGSWPVQVRIDRAVGIKAGQSCPSGNAGRRFKGRYRKVATLRRLATRPAAAGRRRLTLRRRLAPGLYRLTVRAHLDQGRLSAPVRRYVHVMRQEGP
jgi:hypothetical protein